MLSDYIHSNFDSPSSKKGQGTTTKKNKKNNMKEKKETSQRKKDSVDKNTITQRQVSQKDKIPEEAHHHLTDTIKEQLQEFIGHFEHASHFFKDNKFIRTGYRINFHTPKKVLKSLFMIHNETVNIWTHLAGAIALIVICVFLCFSVNSLDTQNLKTFVQTEITDLFEPIYTHLHLPNFSQIEHDVTEKIHQTKEDITKFGETTLFSLEKKIDAISMEIEHVKEDLNPEKIGRFLTNMKNQLQELPSQIKDSVQKINHETLKKYSDNLKAKISDLQSKLLLKIDSSDFDWIDIYKYIHPDYNQSPTLKTGSQLVPLSRWPIIVFILSAVFCLLCSAIYHLFYCLNRKVNAVLMRLDYAGVSILITGSCFPPYVYGFYCQPIVQTVYLSIMGVTSIIVFFISLGDKIHSEPYRKHKSLMYGGLGILAGTPLFHLTYNLLTAQDPHDNLDFVPSLPYYLSMGFFYLGGLAIYATKVPERFMPGKFDLLGHSHQIWHVCVLLGIILTYFGAFHNYYTRIKLPCIGCEL